MKHDVTGTCPTIIQGGMGVGVSGWRLANAVCRAGQLGVVSGTGLDLVMARRLQGGDSGGHMRRALARFPFPDIADRIIQRFFRRGGKRSDKPFRSKPMPNHRLSRSLTELLVASNFAEVFLAREHHDRPVGINYLEKIQTTTLPSLYGAMLGGVAYVLMGAGIPKAIPGVLDQLALNQPVALGLDVSGENPEPAQMHFDPRTINHGHVPTVTRPSFLAIISSSALATMLARRSIGSVEGFVVEGHTAGGHNAPPRGPLQLSVDGEPIYSERDEPDLAAIRALGLPFWLAGSYAGPEQLARAKQVGAVGVQVGTAFAYCAESDMDDTLKARVLSASRSGTVRIFTDPLASPTGFPFKIVEVPGTLSERFVVERRSRRCDLGYLRQTYRKSDGTIGWRCPAEPVDDYVRKGGDEKNTHGRLCVCNALLATIGLGQVGADGSPEPPLVTSGDEVRNVARFLKPGAASYSAAEVIQAILPGSTLTPDLEHFAEEIIDDESLSESPNRST